MNGQHPNEAADQILDAMAREGVVIAGGGMHDRRARRIIADKLEELRRGWAEETRTAGPMIEGTILGPPFCRCVEPLSGSWADLPLGRIAMHGTYGGVRYSALRSCSICCGTGRSE